MKGTIQPGHIPVNKYELLVVGMPLLTPIEVSGLEEEIAKIELPDRTAVSGGNTGPTEFTMTIPAHHSIEIAAMEAWFASAQDPVLPGYKKQSALSMTSVALGGPTRSFNLVGCWPTKRKTPDLEMKNDGDMASFEYTMSVDQILPGT